MFLVVRRTIEVMAFSAIQKIVIPDQLSDRHSREGGNHSGL